MCGIAGLIFSSPQHVSQKLLASLLASIEHRGPDDYGVMALTASGVNKGRCLELEEPASLLFAHHRLSILELSQAGWQPMSSSDNQYHIVFNGEIYNYIELKAELIAQGYKFNSNSDTEVLLTAYRAWGVSCLNRFIGMFAFAILDLNKQSVFIARDFFGIKPLYYAVTSRGFAFASEIPALLNLPEIRRKVNPQRIYEYLRFGVTDHGSETLFAEINQLLPAHYLMISLNNPQRVEPQCFWTLDIHDQSTLSFDDAAEKLKELFLQSVRLHLRSDVPVGTALSGGIDSSSIVMMMRHLEPDLDIQTFSYIASDPRISEEKYCRIVTDAASTNSHTVQPSVEELSQDLESLIRLQGEPFGSTTIYAQHRVFRLAREAGIKVMLDGQGADEILAGYIPFKGAYLASLLRKNRWKDAYRFAQKTTRNSDISSKLLAQWTANYTFPPQLQSLGRRIVGKDLRPEWLNWEWLESRGAKSYSLIHDTGNGSFKEILRSSLFYGLPKLLRYEDRNSMFFGIESRVPFLTPELVSFVYSLPANYIITSDGISKGIFRQAMRGIVPDSILDRRDKIGFSTPEKKWLTSANSLKQNILQDKNLAQIPCLNSLGVRNELEKFCNGKSTVSNSVWRLTNFVKWSEQFKAEY